MSEAVQLTELLRMWQDGDPGALESMEPLVYSELRKVARSHLRSEGGHTLQATELVNEMFLRLTGSSLELADRKHFFVIASRAMRRILVDHARSRSRQKRGSGEAPVTFEEERAGGSGGRSADLLALDDALAQLGELESRAAEVLEMHYFGGLTYDEVASALEVSPATVKRDLRIGKAFIRERLTGGS